MLWWEKPGLTDQFDSRVQPDSAGCLIWQDRKDRDGYGIMSTGRRGGRRAHRLSLERKIGRALAPGEQSLHSCDVPSCVNPEHLRVGAPLDNARDRVERGQQARGERQGLAKLTEAQVYEIRDLIATRRFSLQTIADRYGVSRPTIGQIKRRVTWTHLPAREAK